MSKRTIIEIATKLFGLYIVIRFLESIPSIGMAAATYNSDHVSNSYLYFGSVLLLPIIYGILSYIFIFKSSSISGIISIRSERSDEIQSDITNLNRLSLWVQVIGLYYFVMSSGSLIAHISQLANRGLYWWTPVISKSLILCISLWFIFRTRSVVSIIEAKSK